MEEFELLVQPAGKRLLVPGGVTVLEALRQGGFSPEAPCSGRGTCGKCKVKLDGQEQLACQVLVNRSMTVELPAQQQAAILTTGLGQTVRPDGKNAYVLAFDVGTTTVVGYLLDGRTGQLLGQASCLNPQKEYGADVISRIERVQTEGSGAMQQRIVRALSDLTRQAARQAKISPREITLAVAVGNTAMHHLLLGIDPRPLVTPPYMPTVREAVELPARDMLPLAENAVLRVLPNIAGFVGADTVGCMVSTRMDRVEQLTLMIDIGTNGEMILGDQNRRIACSTAAGPAFEGAKITCGMRGASGAVDHVWLEDGKICRHVIGDGMALGLCGSGLLDLISVLLQTGDLKPNGRLPGGDYYLEGTKVYVTQKDIREVQLAKGAIRAGIELMCEHLGHAVENIETVYLAGAFGNYLDPAVACRIGMIPPCLLEKIRPIGNAAGEGARLCALSEEEFAYSKKLAAQTEFLELASLPEFQRRFIFSLNFEGSKK